MHQRQSLLASVSSCVSINQLCVSDSAARADVCLPTAMPLGWQSCQAAEPVLRMPCRHVLCSQIKASIRIFKLRCNSVTKLCGGRCWWRNTEKGANRVVVTILVPPVNLHMLCICIKQAEPKQLRGRNVLPVQWLHAAFFFWNPVSPLLNTQYSISTKNHTVGDY